MELNQDESVTQSSTSSAVSEDQRTIEVSDDAAENMPKGFKEDFFKQKELARESKKREQAALERVREFEEKEAQRDGNHQKIIDTLKEENASLKGEITAGQKKKQLEKFNSTLVKKAEELGFTKPERIMNFINDDDKGLLVLDEDFNIDEYGMDKAFDNVKKEWSELFRPKHIKVADGTPRTNIEQSTKKSVDKMSTAERMQAIRLLNKK